MGRIDVRFSGTDARLQEIFVIIEDIYNSRRNKIEELVVIAKEPKEGGNPKYKNRDSLLYFNMDFNLLKSVFERLKADFAG